MMIIRLFFVFIVLTTNCLANNEDTIVRYQNGALTKEERFFIHDKILAVVQSNYGNIATYSGFDLAIKNYVHRRVTGEKSPNNSDLPDVFYSVCFSHVPSEAMINECFQEKIDELKASGLPIHPDRYRIGIIEEDGRAYAVLALDETYIAPGTE
jgi:hypothetical protein